MLKTFPLPALALLLCSALSAQTTERDVLANAGGTADIPGYTITWTLGETFVATRENADATIILTEGFQQPESGMVPTFDLPGDDQTVTVAPNPAGNSLTISLSKMPAVPLRATLTDAAGRSVREETVTGQTTTLDLQGLPAAWYFLSLSDGKTWSRTVKVVKQ